MANKYLRVTITYRDGAQSEMFASEFDIDFEPQTQNARAGVPQKFTYKGVSGEELSFYLSVPQLAGIAVTETYQ